MIRADVSAALVDLSLFLAFVFADHDRLDTQEYTKAAQDVWDEEHGSLLAELHRMGITDFSGGKETIACEEQGTDPEFSRHGGSAAGWNW